MTGRGRRWKTLVSRYGSSKLDIEFPTAALRPWKSPTTRFPHSHSAGDGFTRIKQEDETKTYPLRRSARRGSRTELLLETKSGFNIILRFE